jgi:hypothetical protein
MRKYGHVINIGIQNTLVYRVNFLFRSVFGLIPLTATIMLWRAIYDGKPPDAKVSEYTLAQMISYYLLVTIVDALTAVTEDDWQIAADIKDGNISQFLLKPIDYLGYRLCLFLSGRLIYTAVALVPVGLFILYLHQYFVLPPDMVTFGGFLISVVMTGTASVFHFLYDGFARVLGPRSGHLYFHSLRLRVPRRRAPVSSQHLAGGSGASARIHAISLSPLFPREYLFRPTKQRCTMAGTANSGWLGVVRLCSGALCLESRDKKIFRRRWLTRAVT